MKDTAKQKVEGMSILKTIGSHLNRPWLFFIATYG